jgi:hypothetical protein
MKNTLLTTLIILLSLSGFAQIIRLTGNDGNGFYNGKLGIGIPVPAYRLDVVGTFGPRLRVYSQDGYFAGLLAKNSTHEYFIGVQGTWEANGGTNSGFHIYDNTVGARRMVIDATGNMGVGTSAPDAKLHVAGTLKIVDGSQGAGKVLTSDTNGLASWISPVVNTANDKSIKDLQAAVTKLNIENEELRSQINSMNDCIQSLCNEESKSAKPVEINDNMLFQNQPNPFNQSTVIRYQQIADTGHGRIIVRDLNGRIIKSLTTTGSGKGQVTINANELAQGTYTYTLVVNNESTDTKLMVVTR